jgi:TRAP-type mannitol/chloroaromatic compound transport system permease large subunit
MIAVLGSILAGVATPTEAAAVGATGATLLGGLRARADRQVPVFAAFAGLVLVLILTSTVDLRLGRAESSAIELAGIATASICCLAIVWGVAESLVQLRRNGTLDKVMRTTTRLSAMIFGIIIGAAFFSLVFRGLKGDDIVHAFLTNLPGGPAGAMIMVMLIIFLLGFFLDLIEINFVVVPLVAPVLLLMGFNPVWLGIMIAMNLQTSFLTPPFGFALFYLRGVAPPEVTTIDIYRGIVPFVALQLLMLGVLAAFPELALWLPKLVYGSVAQ